MTPIPRTHGDNLTRLDDLWPEVGQAVEVLIPDALDELQADGDLAELRALCGRIRRARASLLVAQMLTVRAVWRLERRIEGNAA